MRTLDQNTKLPLITPHKDTSHSDIGLCAQNMNTILGCSQTQLGESCNH